MSKKVCWISLNQDCNLRCSWCYAREQGYSSVQMDKRLLFELIDFCCDSGVDKVVFLGGEPTLYPFLTEAIKYAKMHNLKTEITTNGLMLADENYLSRLIDTGLDSVMMSVKGYDKSSFIKTTGVDGYGDAIKAIDNLVSRGMHFGVSFVLTDEFLKGIEYAVADMQKHGVPLIVFSLAKEYSNTPEAQDFCKCNSPYVLIPRFCDKMKNLEGKLDKTKWLLELCFGLSFNGEEAQLLDRHIHYSCKCSVVDSIIFDCYGNLLACNTMPNSTLGTFKTDFNNYEEYKRYMTKVDE